MNDERTEIEDCVVEENNTHVGGSLRRRAVLERQTTLDAFLLGGLDRRAFVSGKLIREKTKSNRMSITITHSVISRSKLKSRKSFGSVVEEVDRGGSDEQGRYDWMRMTGVMKKAKMKAEKTTLDKYIESPMQSIRCYKDMYPDLISRNASDVVLVSINSITSGTFKPYPVVCADRTYGWNSGKKFVRLPYSICNVTGGIARYDIIQTAISKLLEPLKTYKQIEDCIRSYSRARSFNALRQLFEAVLSEALRVEYLTTVIPFMAKLALQSPSLITQPIPILRRGSSGSVTISQHQAASLLAHAFFCTFPSRNTVSNELPPINFWRLFSLHSANAVEKLRCLMHYFHMVSKKMPTGLLTIRRQNDSAQEWSSMHLPLSKLYVSHTGTIEDDGHGMLQVDFANEYIGGGVLSGGCVQEEIRFLICPEMIVSMILCEKMHHNEAIVICGAERFSGYDGYGSSFRWRPMEKMDSFPRDRFHRLCCELVAIDALPFSNKHEQFSVELVDRELLKAYVGFAVNDGTMKPVATGNWGCGVFGGDLHLKSLIQLMASSARKRCLYYFTFGNQKFAEDFTEIYGILVQTGTTVGQLYDMINGYCSEYDRNSSPPLFEYISWKIKGNIVLNT
ncbi:Poly(ADP-ribose) glycohydrolase [Loa loa]|uniref:poly(ADP-ribose) glycohydrolase n=1 Tax=Loa loa TaxID=7209 RepID=A0A1I7VE86_LOALO|nr:Poly(ADP-ribose) glycohydrolase [Loa loa]EFO25964.2 Poly(ADP-ribose) glycohydrolase [Loa loa]